MVLKNFSFIFMVFLLYSKDMATANSPKYCSFIMSSVFKLHIFDLEVAKIKSTFYLNVTEIENYTVDEFLDYLKNVKHLALSSHIASARNLNAPKNISPFTSIPSTTPLCQAIDVMYDVWLAEQQYTLYIGMELNQKQVLMRRFLKGLVIDESTGHFKMSSLSPVIFNKTFQPTEKFPTQNIDFQKHMLKIFNENDISAEILENIISMSAKYHKQQNFTLENSIRTKYAVVSLLNKQTEFLISEDNMDLEPTFIKKLYDIVDNNDLKKNIRTKRVIKLLNLYGLYIPNNFILGGRLDVIKPVNELNTFNENAELENLAAKLSAAYGIYDGSLVNTNPYFTSNEHITSTVDQAIDIPTFMQNNKFKENWKIIELKNIIPTCKLLLKKHSNLFAEIRRLIISVGHRRNIRNLQPHIDMLQYVNDIWSEYDQSF